MPPTHASSLRQLLVLSVLRRSVRTGGSLPLKTERLCARGRTRHVLVAQMQAACQRWTTLPALGLRICHEMGSFLAVPALADGRKHNQYVADHAGFTSAIQAPANAFLEPSWTRRRLIGITISTAGEHLGNASACCPDSVSARIRSGQSRVPEGRKGCSGNRADSRRVAEKRRRATRVITRRAFPGMTSGFPDT